MCGYTSTHMEDVQIVTQAVELISTLSYWGIFGFSLIANMIVPVPEEFFLLALGYVSGIDSSINIFITIPLVIGGLFISDIALFSFARSGHRYIRALERKVKNFKFAQNEAFVQKHIRTIIFVSRFVIQFRFIGPVLAGSTKTKWKTFLFWDLFALAVYVPLILFAGNYFNDRITKIIHGIAVAKNYVLIAVVIIAIVWLARLARRTLFKNIIFSLSENQGYKKTWMPWLHKKINKDKE